MDSHSSTAEHSAQPLGIAAGRRTLSPAEAKWREVMPKRIRKARELGKITQTRLQEESGLNPSILSHVERGTRLPSIETFVKISTELGVSPDWLLGLPERKAPTNASKLPRGYWKRMIGSRLRLARELAGLNQANLSRATGIAARMISNIEGGTRFPSLKNLVLLCGQLKLSVEWLLSMPSLPRGE